MRKHEKIPVLWTLFLIFMSLQLIKAHDWNKIKKNIQAIKQDCGEVCDTSENLKLTPGPIFNQVDKNINCDGLFSSKHIDTKDDIIFKHAPSLGEIPQDIIKLFTYQNRLSIREFYFDQADFSTKKKNDQARIWSKEIFHQFETIYNRKGEMSYLMGYDSEIVYKIADLIEETMLDKVKNRHVLVIGSDSPWIETILLDKGAAKITTLEYANITVEHPKITVIGPQKFKELYNNEKKEPLFDAVISYSSVEHSGLGRYGEALNPWGDLITMAKAWCLTKSGGKALIGVPSGLDSIIFNGNRNYGRIMYPHLFANWKILQSQYKDLFNGVKTNPRKFCPRNSSKNILWCYQPITILQKENSVGENIP